MNKVTQVVRSAIRKLRGLSADEIKPQQPLRSLDQIAQDEASESRNTSTFPARR